MYKTIGMVAHVDAGKTTLIEQLLYNAKVIQKAGRVDNKNTFLDYHSIEKQRGITVFSDQAMLSFNNCTYYLVDTPGHVDFSTEMERSIRILDAAVIILSSVEGIEGHTETIWRLLKKYNVPTLFFINKLDREGADFNRVVKEIKESFTDDLCILSKPLSPSSFCDIKLLIDDKTIDPSIVEFIADRNDEIMQKYLEDMHIETADLINTMKNLFMKNEIFPCLCGSTLKNIGVKELMFIIDLLIDTNYNTKAKFKGTVYKIRYDGNNKLTFIKALEGKIKVKDSVVHKINGEKIYEKINEIREYNGAKYTQLNEVQAGQIVGVTGLNSSYVGEGIGDIEDFNHFELNPALKSKVNIEDSTNPKEVLKVFQILTQEDPSLNVTWVEALKEIHIHVMGIIQLEVLKNIVKDRFNIDVNFGTPEVIYKETITQNTRGFGHFEPLRHYAEVEILMSPSSRGSGITFSSNCSVDILDTRWQRLIEKSIIDGTKRGILTGSPLTDIHITLIRGKSHIKHTSGGDFREATLRAIRQGIDKVNNILLEPYYNFTIKVNKSLCGRVMNDITKMYGKFDPPILKNDKAILTGTVPVATSMNYPSELASFTQGKGAISFNFKGYDVCHNSSEVIEKIGYDKNKDPEYTSNSIFCSHGKAYTVSGKDLN